MLINASELTDSIRPYDTETAEHLEFLARKMKHDLTRLIKRSVEPARKKMVRQTSKIMHDKYKDMLRKAGKTISRRYRNAVRSSIAYMNYKKFKSGESKLKIIKGSDGKWTCVPIKPPKAPSSSNQTFRIDTEPDQSVHTQTHNDSNANHTCNASQSHADSHTDPPPYCATDYDDDDDDDDDDPMTAQPLEFPHQRTPTAPASRLNIRKVVTTYKVEPRQCKQNGELPDIDYSEHPAFAHAAIHNYLRNCNCQACIKKLFQAQISANEGKICKCFYNSKCICHTCQPYSFYEAQQLSAMTQRS